jgi:hypothetical protein
MNILNVIMMDYFVPTKYKHAAEQVEDTSSADT